MRTVAFLSMVSLMLAACGSTEKKDLGIRDKGRADSRTTDGGVQLDTGSLDVSLADKNKPAADLGQNQNFGEGCTSNKDCKSGSPLCVIISQTPKLQGVCSRECKPDNPNTPLINEDDCPTSFMCASFRYSTQTYNYCLKKCTPSLTTNPCPASSNTTCHPVSTRFGELDQAVCWYLACKADKDCPVFADKKCNTDADCTSIAADAFCEAATTATDKRCARPGTCGKGGLCAPHKYGSTTAKVGDPCKSDLDCPANGSCLLEQSGSASGAIGLLYHNGYCTIRNCSFANDLPEFKCPTGSTCHNLFYGGLCHKTCDMTKAAECRGNAADKGGDYECYAWNNLSVGGVNVTDGPVCQSAATQTCDTLGTKLDCSSLAAQGNPTNMSCRDRFNGTKKTNPADPNGICLDDTASGAFDVAGDLGVKADAGTKIDAGTKVDGATKVDAKTDK